MRLQRFLSDAGVSSRRHAEEHILEGRVLVNGQVVDKLPAFVDPERDQVVFDGAPVKIQKHAYFLVHKPVGVVCTNHDPGGRVRAVDLLPENYRHLFPVGRLDADSSGLLLMTNDGELAQRITHPRYGIPKIYRVEVRGRAPADLPAQMRKGVYLSDGRARASETQIVHAGRETSVLLVTLREGKNRQVRRMLARLGFPVKALKRVQIGPLSIRGLPHGAARQLSERELEALRGSIQPEVGATGEGAGPSRRRRRRPGAEPQSGAGRAGDARRTAAGGGSARPAAGKSRGSREGGPPARRVIT